MVLGGIGGARGDGYFIVIHIDERQSGGLPAAGDVDIERVYLSGAYESKREVL